MANCERIAAGYGLAEARKRVWCTARERRRLSARAVPGLLSLLFLLLPLFFVPLSSFFVFFNPHYNDTPFALLPFTIVFLPFTLIRQARRRRERDLLFLLATLSRTKTRERIR
jgi:hypothetical protein